jgi:hypothetical protein
MEDGITPWFEVDALRVWLECDKKQTYNLFKHFRNKVLEVAVTEISDVTGLDISMLMQNVPGSKKVGSVRFKWKGGQHSDEQKTALVILRNTYETLRNEFALNQSEFDEIIKNRLTYTDERIQQAIEYTRHQATAGKVRLRAGGYFMTRSTDKPTTGREDRVLGDDRTDKGSPREKCREGIHCQTEEGIGTWLGSISSIRSIHPRETCFRVLQAADLKTDRKAH